MGRPHASWLQQVDQHLKEMGDGPGIYLEDDQTEAPGVPAESGRSDALLRCMLPYLPTCPHPSIHPLGPNSVQSIGAASAVSLAIGHNPGQVTTPTQ